MANKTNKYGRQIFFTRKHIELLRELVEGQIVGCDDHLHQVDESLEWTSNGEYLKTWEAEKRETEARKKELQDIMEKLFYYVDETELEGSK